MVRQIKTGWSHALAIKDNGDLVGIGRNGGGELGLGDKTCLVKYPLHHRD